MPESTPFLVRRAVPRSPAALPPGRYDHARQVLTVTRAGIEVPVVHALSDRALEIQTKTKVEHEADDEIPGMLEMMTKTFVAVERDEDDEDESIR